MVSDAIAAAGAVAGLFTNSKDGERLTRNTFAYNLALTSGNQAAVDFLAGRAGLFGIVGKQVAGFGDKDTPGLIGTWATSKAATDALVKYNGLKSSGVIGSDGKVVAKAGVAGNTTGTPATTISAAGFGAGLPLWAMVLLAGGLGLAIWKATRR